MKALVLILAIAAVIAWQAFRRLNHTPEMLPNYEWPGW